MVLGSVVMSLVLFLSQSHRRQKSGSPLLSAHPISVPTVSCLLQRLCCPVSAPLSPSLPPRLGTGPLQILLLPFVILQTLFLLPCGTLLSPLFAVWLCLSLCFHLLAPFSSSSSLHASPHETLLLTFPPASFSLIPSLHLPPPSISLQHLTPPLNPALSLPCLPRLFPSSPEHTHLFFFFLLAILPSFIPVIV